MGESHRIVDREERAGVAGPRVDAVQVAELQQLLDRPGGAVVGDAERAGDLGMGDPDRAAAGPAEVIDPAPDAEVAVFDAVVDEQTK